MTTTTALPPGVPPTHPAVVTVGRRVPLEILARPTEAPGPGEALVHVKWTSSSPLDLHQADGGLLIAEYPYIMGTAWAGTVVSLGAADPSVPSEHQPRSPLSPGDRVFGFSFLGPREKGFQEYITTPTWLVGRVPPSMTFEQAVAVPTNLITAFHTITNDLGLELPWPLPDGWSEEGGESDKTSRGPILVWGAASSVGLYIIQVLGHWGYTKTRKVIGVASKRHHAELTRLGAAACVDYNEADVVEKILSLTDGEGPPRIPLMVDCIGSLEGSLQPLTKIAQRGSLVAVMLPVVNVHSSSEGSLPEYEMDVSNSLVGEWNEGVVLKGTRTHFYHHNEFFKYHLQPRIIPALLEAGIMEPNKQRVVEGKTLLERAQNAMDLLRERAPSGEKLVWRVAEE